MVFEAGVAGSLGSLADAIERSCLLAPIWLFPIGRKLTIFSPSLISATSLGRGTLSICMYQRSTSSVKASISFSRLLATGLMVGIVGRIGDAGAQRVDRGVDLALLAAGGDPRRHFPDVGLGLEMIAAVAEDRHPPDQVPGQQFLDRIGDVGARHAERLGDVLGGHRRLGEIEQAVDLADRAVDAPLVPHVAPVQDEPLDGGREFLFAGYFCHDRNI